MDMVPGMVTYFWLTPTRTGTFDILCAELCGVGPAYLRGVVMLETEADPRAWLQEPHTLRLASSATLSGTTERPGHTRGTHPDATQSAATRIVNNETGDQ